MPYKITALENHYFLKQKPSSKTTKYCQTNLAMMAMVDLYHTPEDN